VRIVCLTSNDYINCLVPFAHYWNRFAGADRGVTVVCYERLPEGLPKNFDVVMIGQQSEYTWSSGLLRFLRLIGDEVILLMLEDYFLSAPPHWDRIDELDWWMAQTPYHVAKIDLSGDRLKTPHRVLGADLVSSTLDAPFQASVQAALWNVEFLRQMLDASENAWQFEEKGTKRIEALRRSGHYVDGILGTRTPSMGYANAVGGAGHKPGVIEPKHMPGWMWQECIEKGWAHG
jgi:hypothetical protein